MYRGGICAHARAAQPGPPRPVLELLLVATALLVDGAGAGEADASPQPVGHSLGLRRAAS